MNFYDLEIAWLSLLFWLNFARKSRRFSCNFGKTVISAVFWSFKKASQTFWDRIIFKNQIFGGPYWISRSYVLSKISADLFCASSRPFDDYCFIWNISKNEYAKPFSVLWVFHMKQSKGPPHITKNKLASHFRYVSRETRPFPRMFHMKHFKACKKAKIGRILAYAELKIWLKSEKRIKK